MPANSPVPNFIIPGAQKCGTTYLYHMLRAHPACFMPDVKEPHVLASPEAPSAERYFSLFHAACGSPSMVALGEASTSYLVVPEVPERILSSCGRDVRFIFLLRNPIERVLSSYLHMYKRGHELRDWNDLFSPKEGDLDDLSGSECSACVPASENGEIVTTPYRERFGENWKWPFRYIDGSRYAAHLTRFFRHFARGNCHILFLEDIRRDARTEVARVYRFLGLDADFVAQGVNAASNVTQGKRPNTPLNEQNRLWLKQLFADECQRVKDLVGRVPAEWDNRLCVG